MPKEIFLDITAAVVVLGSVFGASHLRKLSSKLQKVLPHEQHLRKPPQKADTSAGSPCDDVFEATRAEK
jgi:hypothetical protein